MEYISQKMIAARAGVSGGAVSLALRNQPGVSRDVALKIQEIARSLDYQPPALLREAMGQLKKKKSTRFDSQIAVCTGIDPDNWNRSWGLYWEDLVRHAKTQGYSVELFYLRMMVGRKLQAALRTRNIRGVLLVVEEWLPAEFEFLLKDFASVLLGPARRVGLAIHFTVTDQLQAGRRAMQEVMLRGYQRIGFVNTLLLDPEELYRAGIFSAKADLQVCTLQPNENGIPTRESFLDWVKVEKPQCILTLASEVRSWLEEAGYRIPQDIGIVHLNKNPSDGTDWSGIDPLWREVSIAGFDKIVSMLRQGTSGIPSVQQCVLVEGVWSEGTTLRPAKMKLTYGEEPSPLASSGTEDSSSLKCLNLQPYLNRSLTGPGGWLGERPLQHCPPGEHSICGTRFRIEDETTEGKAALVMASRSDQNHEDPNPSEIEIRIGCRLKAVHFLHGCGWSGGPIRNFASYHFIDSTKHCHTLPLVDRRSVSGPGQDGNIQDWYPSLAPLSGPHVRPVHLTAYGNAQFYSAYLYILEWINPNPHRIIQKLRITSNTAAKTTLGLLAITLRI